MDDHGFSLRLGRVARAGFGAPRWRRACPAGAPDAGGLITEVAALAHARRGRRTRRGAPRSTRFCARVAGGGRRACSRRAADGLGALARGSTRRSTPRTAPGSTSTSPGSAPLLDTQRRRLRPHQLGASGRLRSALASWSVDLQTGPGRPQLTHVVRRAARVASAISVARASDVEPSEQPGAVRARLRRQRRIAGARDHRVPRRRRVGVAAQRLQRDGAVRERRELARRRARARDRAAASASAGAARAQRDRAQPGAEARLVGRLQAARRRRQRAVVGGQRARRRRPVELERQIAEPPLPFAVGDRRRRRPRLERQRRGPLLRARTRTSRESRGGRSAAAKRGRRRTKTRASASRNTSAQRSGSHQATRRLMPAYASSAVSTP